MQKMKIASLVMCLFFVLAIAVQLNDPDPLRWIALYGIAAALSALAALGRGLPWLTAASLVLYLAGVVYLLPSLPDTSLEAFSSIGMSGERDELVRELWGLIICAVWMGVLLMVQWRSPSGESTVGNR
ncbi:MAG: transmembrane 220 family protein [Deltaproteobacteria bacterium]|nr:transmembrane 220 family protein [Deltaproteobacteria bacterium]